MTFGAKKLPERLFYLAFSGIFTHLLIRMIFANDVYGYRWQVLLPGVLLCLALLLGIARALGACGRALVRHCRPIEAGFLGLMFSLQVALGLALRYTPSFDVQAVYQGAIEWVETGTFAGFYEYYLYFPHNLGMLGFFRLYFGAFRALGGQDYFAAAVVLNAALCALTMHAAFDSVRRLAGARRAFFVLAIFALSLPFYWIAAAIYTDAMSMLYPILIYNLYLRAKDEVARRRRLCLYALIGLAAGIGMQIKFTVLIALIAIALDSLFSRPLGRTLALCALAGALAFLIALSTSAHFSAHHLDPAQARAYNTPRLHWVMMGLQGNGGYNPQDYAFTRSFTDPATRQAALRAQIQARLAQLGPRGTLALMTRKALTCFSDGTYALSDFLDDSPARPSRLHEYILYAGAHYEGYRYLCTCVLLALYALMLAGTWRDALLARAAACAALAPRAAVCGILLFLCLWETSGRYFTNYLPLIFTSAALGAGGWGKARRGMRAHGR